MQFFSSHKENTSYAQAGFTLVELMVTIGIVTLVTGVVLIKYSSFNSVVLLKSQAYELALDIRAAQSYGVNNSGKQGAPSREAFGIYLDMANPNAYILFQDEPSGTDLVYDAGEEVGEVYGIDSRFAIQAICTESTCSSPVTSASIAFKRPNFDARIATNPASTPSQLEIVLASVANTAITYSVIVYPSGQISVE